MTSVRNRPQPWLLCLCAVLALLGSACSNTALGTEPEGRDINPAVGRNVVRISPEDRKTKPAFAGDLVAGGKWARDAHLGTVTVVNFWSSWCTPCIKEQPVLERAWKKYEDRGVLFIGINIRDTLPNAKSFLEGFDFPVTYPSIFDDDQGLAHAFRVTAPPSTFVLDRSGRVAARVVGEVTEAGELDVLIDQVLGE